MAGLYDSVRIAQNPYMSQFVGSIVPELNNYSQTVQAKYNQAADQDDNLTEALGNLQHLNLDADTQYANELKQQYYQRLVDRSSRGDFENMGRRTRHDAVQFAQAYQPLIQRQKDFAEIVKKVNSDTNIADPEKKAQILGYIQNMNSTKRDATGDFQRDGSGRVNLGSIQDWAYAKDVDINKKLADLLDKKEADIRQSGFTSDGEGNRISTVDKVRDPAVMASLARQMMATDPEIRAMIKRDATLATYQLTPDDVRTRLAEADVSPYQAAKRRGLNDKQIAIMAKAEGLSPNDVRTSSISRQRAQLMAQGMSEESANKAILNSLTEQQLAEPHAKAIGELLGISQHTLEAKDDPMFLLRAKKSMEDAENNSFQVLQSGLINPQQIDPDKVTTDFAKKQTETRALGSNVNSAVLAAMRVAGVTTGNQAKDIALANQYANSKAKMNELKGIVNAKDPDLAGRLETLQNSYIAAKDELQYHELTTKKLEDVSGVNFNELYKIYRSSPTNTVMAGFLGLGKDKHLTMDQFQEVLRNKGVSDRGFLSRNTTTADGLKKAIDQYDKLTEEGAKKVKDGAVNMNAFSTYIPTGQGALKKYTDYLEQNSKTGTIRFKELGTGDSSEKTMAEILGLKAKNLNDPKEDDFKTMKGAEIFFNRNSVGGKPTVMIRTADGAQHFATVEKGLDPALMTEVNAHLAKEAMANKTADQARSQFADVAISAGERTMHTSIDDLKSQAPSSVPYKLNDRYDVVVKPGGPTGKRFKVYITGTKQEVKTFNSADDLAIALGTSEIKRSTAP